MSVAKFSMSMEWKKHILSGAGTEESPYVYGDVIPMDLRAIDAWMKANAEHYCGNSAHAKLDLWFDEEPSDAVKAEVQAYLDALDENSPEAISYKSKEELKAAENAKAASGKAKLKALGLSDDEIAALLG